MPMHYVEMQAQSVLNRLPHDNFVFRWSINLYRGCRHACPFCYARYTHWFLGYEQPRDFQEIIEVKTNAPQVLAMELASPNWARELVSLGAATDNYQPAEKQYRLTRETLKLLAQHRTPAIFSTKSDLVLRDIDVLQDLTRRAYVGVAMTITTMDHKSGLFLEPHAVPVARRMRALERLKAAGITTGVHLMPLMPGISDTDEAMEAICRAAKEVGVDYLIHSHLRLQGPVVRKYFFQRLKAYDQTLYRKYRRLYDGSAHPPAAYRREVDRRFSQIRQFYGLSSDTQFVQARERQMDLFSPAPGAIKRHKTGSRVLPRSYTPAVRHAAVA